ncbi:unnamed protein product [Musa textilis]
MSSFRSRREAEINHGKEGIQWRYPYSRGRRQTLLKTFASASLLLEDKDVRQSFMGSAGEQRNETEHHRPVGVRFLEYIRGAPFTFRTYQAIVLVLTFFAYASFHATRKTTSIVKSVLDPQTTELGFTHWSRFYFLGTVDGAQRNPGLNAGWAPFDTSDGTAMLGQIDVAFLSIYSLGMYFAGHLGDRFDLRVLLALGMAGTGIFTSLFGAGYWLNIHSFYYFLAVQMLAGLFQSTGWPSVVAVVGNWFGKKKRGLIMGIWNAHTSIGNISGSLIASALLKYGWGYSFAVPGLIIALFGLTVFLFLPVSPEKMGIENEEESQLKSPEKDGITQPLLDGRPNEKGRAVGFVEAWGIPGVAPFALCLFFSKLVAYTFLYWLPFYISHTAIDGKYLSDSTAGTLSTLFDVGGVVGGNPRRSHLRPTRCPRTDSGKLHVLRHPSPLLLPHLREHLPVLERSAHVRRRHVCQWPLCIDNNGSIGGPGNAQLPEGEFPGLGHRHCDNRRDRVSGRCHWAPAHGLYISQQLECSVHHAHGSGTGGWAALDEACGGRGDGKNGVWWVANWLATEVLRT